MKTTERAITRERRRGFRRRLPCRSALCDNRTRYKLSFRRRRRFVLISLILSFFSLSCVFWFFVCVFEFTRDGVEVDVKKEITIYFSPNVGRVTRVR